MINRLQIELGYSVVERRQGGKYGGNTVPTDHGEFLPAYQHRRGKFQLYTKPVSGIIYNDQNPVIEFYKFFQKEIANKNHPFHDESSRTDLTERPDEALSDGKVFFAFQSTESMD